ncbi:reverse transcriptase domain-containing protein [Tanacetum coccineum]
MWESAKTVAPTPNFAIVQPNVDDNFVINSTHLKMILENKFDSILRADPHDHIREFLSICYMFKYGETQSEAVKLLIFPYSLCDEAKTRFNKLNEESITSWDQMRRALINRFFPPSLFNRLLLKIRNFSQNVCESLTEAWLGLKNMLQKFHGHDLTKGAIIHIFYHGLDEPTQEFLDRTAGGIFLYKSPNQAFQLLEDKVLFKLDWSTKSKNDHHQNFVAFADGSNNDNSRLMENLEALTIKMDSQFQTLKEEIQDMRNKYYDLKDNHTSKNNMNDDTPMCEHHEANYIQFEGYQNRNSQDSYSHQSHNDPNYSKKSLTKLINDVKNDLEDFKSCIRSMRTVYSKLFDKDDDEWEKSQNVFSEQTNRTEPPPPPPACTEQVNSVFTESEKSDDPLNIQKDAPPPIIVNNKIKKDKPFKTSKKDYYVVKLKEYPFPVMSADSTVTYTSVHSEARSWSIPSEDPYEEAARQLLEQAPRSPDE